MNFASHHVLMCAPTHYAIHYEINPWMRVNNPIDRRLARRQWNALHARLKKLGVDVQLVSQQKGCPDMVFTANAGVVQGTRFIPSHFRYVERQSETEAFVRYFKRHGYAIADDAKGMFFEGEGDLLPFRDLLFGGFRYRSERRAHEKVSASLQKPVITLELARPHFYHLDTCLFPLDDQTVIYFPGAFDAAGLRAIRRAVKRPVAVTAEDAERFACNAFRVGQTVVVNTVSRTFKKRLHALGYDVAETPTSEFIKAGGSVKCLLLRL